jgi:hypothetical protein
MLHLSWRGRQPVSVSPPQEPAPRRTGPARRAGIALKRLGAAVRSMLDAGGQPEPVAPSLRRFAWLGIIQTGGLAAILLIAQRTSDSFSGARPFRLFVGWGVLRQAAVIYGPPQRTMVLSAATALAGLTLAYTTRGFQYARWAGRMAAAGIGLAGVVAGIPVAVIAGVLIAGIALWLGLFALVSLALMLWVFLLLFIRRVPR